MSGVCQSWVSTTFWKALDNLLMRGMISSPLLTARLPPGVKQFCTSTTIKAASIPGVILVCASARGMSEATPRPQVPARKQRREKVCIGLILLAS